MKDLFTLLIALLFALAIAGGAKAASTISKADENAKSPRFIASPAELKARIASQPAQTKQVEPITETAPWAACLKTSGTLRVAVAPPSDPRFAHLAWPKALRLSDGTIVLACLAGAYHGGGGCPAVSLSTDDGKTFTPPKILREFGPGKDYGNSGNLALGLAGDGAVVLLAMAHSGDTRNNIFGWRSTDRGRTWSPVDTSALGPNKTGSVTGTIIAVPGVGLMAAGHYRKGSTPDTQGIWVSVSRDDGRSWGAAQRVSDIDAGEPVLVRAGGRLMIFIRGRGANEKRQYLAVSDDHGATWRTSLIDITAAQPKSTLTHPFAMMNPDKPEELLALTAERPLPGQIWLWRGDPQKLAWRRDRLLLELPKIAGDKHNDYGYPWLVPLGGGRALVFFYHGLARGANPIWVAEITL